MTTRGAAHAEMPTSTEAGSRRRPSPHALSTASLRVQPASSAEADGVRSSSASSRREHTVGEHVILSEGRELIRGGLSYWDWISRATRDDKRVVKMRRRGLLSVQNWIGGRPGRGGAEKRSPI